MDGVVTPREARAIIRRFDPGRALLSDWLDPLPAACGRRVCDGCRLCALADGVEAVRLAVRDPFVPGPR